MKAIFTYLFFGFIVYFLCGCNSSHKTDQDYSRPNILFILVDDLGKEWISCYGADDIETPNIDRLAETGMKFENAYSMPQCTPSRLTLLTGQYPFRHGWVNHWDVPRWGGGAHYDPEMNPSLGKLLKEAGYKTAIAGKWQVSDFRVQPNAMNLHGFDEYCMWTGGEGNNPPSNKRYWHPYIHSKDGSMTYKGAYGPDIFTEFLIDFMSKHAAEEQPLFMYYPMVLTHTPFVTTPAQPDIAIDDKLGRHKAMVAYTDTLIGRLINALELYGMRQNTLVIFTTDNGTARGITGSLNGKQIKGAKAMINEPGACQPFIVSSPGIVPEGVTTDALTDFTDILPTFLEIASASPPESWTFDGHSIAGVFIGENHVGPRDWIMSMGGGNRARLTENGVENEWIYRDRVLRNKTYKLYVNTNGEAEQLYHLIEDPDEKINLIDAHENQNAMDNLTALMKIVESFPEQDNDPIYTPLPAQSWDVEITAESQTWKKGIQVSQR